MQLHVGCSEIFMVNFTCSFQGIGADESLKW